MAPIPFLPQDSELLDCLLRPKIAGAHIDSRFTELVGYVDDVYALPPDQLAARHEGTPGEGGDRVWYFFAPLGTARGRTVGGDGSKRWCSVGSRKKVEGGGAGAGGWYCQKLRYTEKTASGVVAPGWMMAQYSVAQEKGGEGGAELLLCKIFRSPRAEPGSPSSSKSASASPSASCSGTGSGGRKRKAKGDHLEAPPPSTRTQPFPPNAEALKPEGAAPMNSTANSAGSLLLNTSWHFD